MEMVIASATGSAPWKVSQTKIRLVPVAAMAPRRSEGRTPSRAATMPPMSAPAIVIQMP